MSQIEDRLQAIAKFAQREEYVEALRDHLRGVLDGPFFSSSRRSGQFLQYVVEQALLQHSDALKERAIGLEVFQRPPDYDTGEDAIVRVTASDVRRRLAQHYSGPGKEAEFRISLPPGGYVPEISTDAAFSQEAWPTPEIVEPKPAWQTEEMAPAVSVSEQPPVPERGYSKAVAAQNEAGGHKWLWLPSLGVLVAVLLLLVGVFWTKSRHSIDESEFKPWAKLFRGGQTVSVVLADPDLNEIQLLTNRYVPLSDYANGKLGCETLPAEQQQVCRQALRGDKVAEVDAHALVRIAEIAARFHGGIEPHAARSLRLPDLQADRNLIILGSKVSNPWSDLYRDQVNFYIDHDPVTGLQIVRNLRPRNGEQSSYVPTAGPYGTGENYALISSVHNLNGRGEVLLLAGCTHEGMDSVMAFLMNKLAFEKTLTDCRLSAEKSFQVLMRIHMMAGSSLAAERLTCRQLE